MIPTSSVLQGHEKQCGDFAETTAFERYGVKTSEKANMPRLARSAHRGRIKFLRGYVSKSSAALNPLTITELSMRGRPVAVTLLGPSHQLAVRMRIIRAYNSTAHACTCIACV